MTECKSNHDYLRVQHVCVCCGKVFDSLEEAQKEIEELKEKE
jgi:ribosomal protein L32